VTLRRVAQPGRRSPGRSVAIAIALLLGVMAGCSTVTPSPTASPEQIPSGSGGNPEATSWPGGVVNAVVQLGAADPQLDQVGKDLTTALNTNDMQTLLDVVNDVQKFLTANQALIFHLEEYPATKTLGDQLAAAYAKMLSGITKIHDSLVAGDGDGVTAGFTEFAAGSTLYAAARPALGDAFNQAIFMKRHFNL
jgi:hypothetical protein